MLQEDLARILRHCNDGFTHPFATDRSPGIEDFARLLRNLESADQDRLSNVLDAIDTVAASHHGCRSCRGKVLVFSELLSINRLPERHAGYAHATECLARETGRDFRREVLEHLATCCRPVRLRIRARELLEHYQEMICRSPWALHLEGLSEELAIQLCGKAEWFLVVGESTLEMVVEVLHYRRSSGKREDMTFALAELTQEGMPCRQRCALIWSITDDISVRSQLMDIIPKRAAVVTCMNTRLRISRPDDLTYLSGFFDRVNEAVKVLLGLESLPFIQSLDCRSGFKAMARYSRGETIWFAGISKEKPLNRSKEVLNELLRRKQQSVEHALADDQLHNDVRRFLADCLPLWKDEPDTLLGDLIPQTRRRMDQGCKIRGL